MFIACVHVHVKAGHVDEFIRATEDNHRHTIQEPGALRFDVIQQIDDPTRFVLYEVYRDEDAVAAHKETDHYARWRDAVADWMAEPRQGIKHRGLFPSDESGWKSA